jgi:hypothetical protein
VNKTAPQGMREHSATHLAKQPINYKSPGRKTTEAFAQTKKENGGGGENRTRVQKYREAGIYKLSLKFPQIPCGPLKTAQTADRVRDYVLTGTIIR